MNAPVNRAIFLADAHLRNPGDINYLALLDFLEEQTGEIDLLIFLGDIFEFWAGDRQNLLACYQPLMDRLKKMVEAGAQLVYVEGNHDFDLGRHFSEGLNCQILPDGGALEINEKRIFLAHGDLANPEDTGYRFLRRFLRSAPLRFLIRHMPAGLVMWIADLSSRSSRNSSEEKRRRWPARDLLIPYAEKILSEGYSTLLTGHYHQPFRQVVNHGELIALGDWIDQYSYVVYEKGAFSLCNYAPPPGATS